MENGSFEHVFPIEHGDICYVCLPEARTLHLCKPTISPRIPSHVPRSSLQAMAMTTTCPTSRASRSSLPKPPPPKAKATPKVSLAAVGLFFFETIWRWPGVSWNWPKLFFRPGENQNHMEVGYHGNSWQLFQSCISLKDPMEWERGATIRFASPLQPH